MGARNSGEPAMSNARDCAIKCGQPLFRAFLRDVIWEPGARDALPMDAEWPIVETADHAAQAIYFLLKIDSRKELDNGKSDLWQTWAGNFELWKRDLPF